MDAVEWDRLEHVFEEALGLPQERRSEYLDLACSGDTYLREQVESLLRHADEAPEFLNQVASGALRPALGAMLNQQNGDPLVGSTVSHYRIEQKIGAGGMGVVYKAHDSRLARTVALKFLPVELTRDERARDRFILEARSASALDHPNICTIYDVDQSEDGQTFIAMGYIEGESLRTKLERGPLPARQALEYAIQIAEALLAAHRKGIVHRDVKPANVMIAEGGVIKLVDFGLAKLTDVHLTATGLTPGTVAYMSPEQITGEEVDGRTDLWSLGVVLYEMLTGRRPFRSGNDQGVLYNILNTPHEPISTSRPELPLSLEVAVDRLLEKRREQRYTDAGEVARVLRDCLDQVSGSGTTRVQARPSRRFVMSAVLVGVVVMTALVALLMRQRPDNIIATGNVPSMAVMYFENQTPEDDLERILVNLLTTNLARYPGLEVVSSQRLFDILKQLGQEDAPFITPAVATEVARKAAVRRMVVGSIIQLGDRIRINAQLVDAETGQILASVQETGSGVEEIFPMVDRLTDAIAREMNLGTSETPIKVADVTTNSYDALKRYQRGLEYAMRWEWVKAQEEFKAATALDTTFAMAYSWLGQIDSFYSYWGTGSHSASPSALRYLEKARRYSSRATERERRIIDLIYLEARGDDAESERLLESYIASNPNDKSALSRYAGNQFMYRKYDTALAYYKRILELDPLEPMARNLLAYTNALMGNGQEAMSAADQYISLQPDVSNTYDTAWEVALITGNTEESYGITRRALARNPAWIDFYRMAGDTRLVQDRPEDARSEYAGLIQAPQPDRQGYEARMGISYAYEGRMVEALQAFERAAAAEITDTLMGAMVPAYLGVILTEMGRYAPARRALSQAEGRLKGEFGIPFHIRVSYYRARASLLSGNQGLYQEDRRALIRNIERLNDPNHRYFLDLLDAERLLRQGNAASALNLLKKVPILGQSHSPDYVRLYSEATAASGRPAEAIRIVQGLRREVMRMRYGGNPLSYFLEVSRLDYRIGKYRQQAGDRGGAAESYRVQLRRWQNADAGRPELIDVRNRLKQVQGVRG